MAILVTGGAGFIGSHTCVELIQKGYDPVIIDNLSNSKEECINRIEKITGKRPAFIKCDIRDKEGLRKIFASNNIEAVIHFAGLKAVGESNDIPLEYYDNNISGTVTLCSVMKEFGCKKIVFSSSATVYGSENPSPLKEDMPEGKTTNPYGTTKLFIERILKDTYKSDNKWSICLLRYFNPIGAHESGLIGEDPKGIPNNLLPYVSQVAVGKLKYVNVFGNDYPTPDGTGVRDYIHVVDLARGHVAALQAIERNCGCAIYNLGTGQGYSVLDVVKTFEKVNGIKIPYSIKPRRAGDIATCYSDPAKAERELGWKAQYGLEEMCRDSWNWQRNNPNGY